MKILVITQYFWPENFRINDICEGFKEQGHEVDVLTGLPNYPEGKIYEGYSFLNKGAKEHNGIRIIRVPMIARGKDNSVKLALNYISFMLSSSIRIVPLIFKKYDKVFVFQVSPITTAIPAILLSKIKKVPSYIYVQDLWPETLYSIINISNNRVRKVMGNICNWIYNKFDTILIASKGYEKILIENKIDNNKIKYFPQWAEDFYTYEVVSKEIKSEKKFVVTFAGNIGKAQSVKTIIEAANLAKENNEIMWRIIGDGSEFNNIKSLVDKYSLSETVELLGRKPATDMPKYFSESDALIVTLKNEEILKVTLPAKIQSYMAVGKPIVAAISGEGNRVIKESNSGLVGEAEDYVSLYKNVINLSNLNKDERMQMGYNGFKFFESNFTRKKLLQKLKIIMNLE